MTLREDSKKEWTSNGSVKHINAGSLQRIADAVEKMSGSYKSLVDERDFYRFQNEEKRKTIDHQKKVIAGLRGYLRGTK